MESVWIEDEKRKRRAGRQKGRRALKKGTRKERS